MPHPNLNPLEQLLRLKDSSSEFHDQVSNILHGEEYKQWAKRVNGADATRFIDFLDRVRRCGPLFDSRSSFRRLSILSTLPVPVFGDACESLGIYAARG